MPAATEICYGGGQMSAATDICYGGRQMAAATYTCNYGGSYLAEWLQQWISWVRVRNNCEVVLQPSAVEFPHMFAATPQPVAAEYVRGCQPG